MEDDVVARICSPVSSRRWLLPGGVEAASVQKECSKCHQPVWFNTKQSSPRPDLEEIIVCVPCVLDDPEIREAALDPERWLE